MSTVVRALGLSALLTLVPVGIGVGVAGDRTPAPKAAVYQGTDLADFDSTTAVVRRAPFCELVAKEAVAEALGGDGELTAWGNGEKAAAVPGGDVAHEYGCAFAGSGAEARAWVFAPPVTRTRAQALAKAAPARGCTTTAGAAAFGTPSVATTCTSGEQRTVSWRGLFGDAWLTCTLTQGVGATEADLVDRAGRWCVAVAQAASVVPS
ncbi:hypothetical protein CFH99_07360 [Nocardioides aromaticivorans]|uniref:Uncharacterized protein n=1 Tax=Nocardioides aromaticivorans TaxID=200618 RepID=A0ABX7PIA4_9ACTN|nr:hypothetical protein [Nocardioides aromaticivorans]QSR25442.1 hypothetical protein CFH99_07360 [Nocardioides aromaticivorans]